MLPEATHQSIHPHRVGWAVIPSIWLLESHQLQVYTGVSDPAREA
jgi:hypothetical protein